jgi:hypothetical protein
MFFTDTTAGTLGKAEGKENSLEIYNFLDFTII